MVKSLMTILIVVAVSLGSILVAGCESDAQTGALLGTAAGAGVGALAGGSTEGTLVGAAVGGGVGYILGNEQDKKKTRAEMDSLRYEMNTIMVKVTNSNGSVIQVPLRKQGVGYAGPRGEYYGKLPTEDLQDLEKAILEISLRMRLLKAMQEDESPSAGLTERDVMILRLLNERGKMTVSQIAAADPNVSNSTISTNITKLWRDKQMVSKTISPENQRTTVVELTDKGKKAIEVVNKQRAERFKTLFQAIEVTDDEKQVLLKILNRAIPFFDKHLGLDKTANE